MQQIMPDSDFLKKILSPFPIPTPEKKKIAIEPAEILGNYT